MTEKQAHNTHTTHSAPKSERNLMQLWKKYQKAIAIFIIAVVIIFGGWFAYQAWIVKPKETKAQEAIFKAEQYFAIDSLQKALNGDGRNKGFLYIINNYKGTASANMAHYYAGVCYLKLGDAAKAISHLKNFKTNAKQVQMMAYGCLGDAYSETNKKTDAVEAYKKASTTFEDDEATSAEYLFRAALLSEVMGKNEQAIELYRSLKEKYPNSPRGIQADKYLYRLHIEPNDLNVQ
jgi:tetratricopeptide (TPR) repeat protein